MNRITLIALTTFLMVSSSFTQVGGGSAAYGGKNSNPAQAERTKRVISKDDLPPDANSMFLDASVLMNVLADEYVAVFAVNQEAESVEACSAKMEAAIAEFTSNLKAMGIQPKDTYVDFVSQNRIYGYKVENDTAVERQVGFELKKNVSIHYKDKAMLDRLISGAAKSQIFDLVKVDYVVLDIPSVHAKLMSAAAQVIKQKLHTHNAVLGIATQGAPQVYAERYAGYYPSDMYESYTAFESEDVGANYYRQKFAVIGARKNKTFYYAPLDGSTFDKVVNPIIAEPVVQFTLYLKVKYVIGKPALKK